MQASSEIPYHCIKFFMFPQEMIIQPLGQPSFQRRAFKKALEALPARLPTELTLVSMYIFFHIHVHAAVLATCCLVSFKSFR